MPALTPNEIRDNALRFAEEWKDAHSENADKQPFWDAFFQVFGVTRRSVAAYFERATRTIRGEHRSIDLIWPGKLIVEHKSRGQSLEKARTQAFEYIETLTDAEKPTYLVVSDFARFAFYDLENQTSHEFPLSDLHRNTHLFGFIAGYERVRLREQDPINIRAAEKLGYLHDALKESGYVGHDLERFLERLLFCFFADDTRIFPLNLFDTILRETRPDGRDTGATINQIFELLDTDIPRRPANLHEQYQSLPYVNGGLFSERLATPHFDARMRDRLLECSDFDWSRISPAIFGSLFQSVKDDPARRAAGMHYTSERDILKVIEPLFLDDLHAEFARAGNSATRLHQLHDKIASFKLLDPACGCGNFLVIAYRELRRLELQILVKLDKMGQLIKNRKGKGERSGEQLTGIAEISRVSVEQMHGIEIDEFAARIAEVALWLVDHQMNQELSTTFGQLFVRLPLTQSPTLRVENALRLDWNDVLPAPECSYVFGNPPFIGARYMSASNRDDMNLVFRGVANSGLLDYVTAWYIKAADYLRAQTTPVAFVSTNSISQGEQVGILWGELYRRGASIHFAHRTFPWQSEARGAAHVHVVIIGWALAEPKARKLFDYSDPNQPAVTEPANISPYLTEGPNIVVTNRSTPLRPDAPRIGIGNKPIDGGHYLFTPEERAEFLAQEPGAEPYFRRWFGAEEFINGIERWCLWLGDINPSVLRGLPHCLERVEAVRQVRLSSRSEPTRRLAETPRRFHVENFPDKRYLVIPSVSSERRPYIPMGFLEPVDITSNLCLIVSNATLYDFGVLTSAMHMAWVKNIGGRLKSDVRYSAKLIYNNFPWPQNPSDRQVAAIVQAAETVLAARERHPGATLADLYDPNTMPDSLRTAHKALDRAVDKAYRTTPFATERDRVAFLLQRYAELTADLATTTTQPLRRRRARVVPPREA